VHALPGLCTLNILEYEISVSCGKFRNHHREPLFGHGNTFDRGRPVVPKNIYLLSFDSSVTVLRSNRVVVLLGFGLAVAYVALWPNG
jgi:hypothetical protein